MCRAAGADGSHRCGRLPCRHSPSTGHGRCTGILRLTTCLLLLGHGALGALNSKPALTTHYASIGLDDLAIGGLTLTRMVGSVEIVLAVAVLVAPFPSLLLVIAVWKMATETLFMTSGALPFEWISVPGAT